MNSTSSINNMTAMPNAEMVIQQMFVSYVNTLIFISALSLTIYTTILQIPQEVQFVWLQKFRLPSLLYIFARYGNLLSQGFVVAYLFVPVGSTCNRIISVENSFYFITFIGGIQGLFAARAYSLCQGNKTLVRLLTFSIFLGVVFNLASTIELRNCFLGPIPFRAAFVNLLANTFVVVTDFLAIAICLWKVWGTWKSKREAGIQNKNDLVTIFLKQIVSSLGFAAILNAASLILTQAFPTNQLFGGLSNLQNGLSAILISNFTLELRRQNAASIEATDISISTLQFQTMLQHIHQSIMVEMGDNDGTANLEITRPDDQINDESSDGINAERSDSAQSRSDVAMLSV